MNGEIRVVCLIREDKMVYRTELLDLRNDFVFKSFFKELIIC